MSKSVRTERNRLYKLDPHCHWCGCLTQRPSEVPGQKLTASTATLDHLVGAPLRGAGDEKFVVLACYACNKLRNTILSKWLAGKDWTKSGIPKPVELPEWKRKLSQFCDQLSTPC